MIRKIIYYFLFFSILFILINADTVDNVKKDESKVQNTIKDVLSVYYDSISKATTLNNKPEIVIEKKEKIIDEKKEVQKESNNKYFLDFFKNKNSDFFYDLDNEKQSTIIIFKENYDTIIPSAEENYEKNTLSEKRIWYQSNDFIPKNHDDFIKSQPTFLYDSNNVIKTSGKTIKNVLGEEIFLKAYKQFKLNNCKNAMQLYNKLIYYNYRIPESYYYLSWCYYLQKDYIMSINCMKEAIKQGENLKFSKSLLSGYSYQIGNTYLELEDYYNAILYFNNSIEKDPSLINNYNKLGICYYNIGEYEKSLEVWKKGMENGDKDCTNNYNWLKKKLNK